jgi:CRP-like cAMP-binding protein
MTGWVKSHRQMLAWEWYTDVPVKVLFLHLLLTANYEPKRWKGVDIGRGQLITGRKELASGSGLTEQQVRTALGKLEKTGEITIKSTSKFSIITVCNYCKYQEQES